MTSKEIEIINAIKAIPDYNEYGYKLESDLIITIAMIMGYKIDTQYRSRGIHRSIANHDDYEKVMMIRNGLKANNIIKSSKSGTTFKLL